ncbi:hypothetical protein BDZ45DRAFT_159110 [Acephala macrosclerotiorum]|nr:hypothetical protein BDZ45DRAFT_159110 [Acephala macrosclerotiorum]
MLFRCQEQSIRPRCHLRRFRPYKLVRCVASVVVRKELTRNCGLCWDYTSTVCVFTFFLALRLMNRVDRREKKKAKGDVASTNTPVNKKGGVVSSGKPVSSSELVSAGKVMSPSELVSAGNMASLPSAQPDPVTFSMSVPTIPTLSANAMSGQ